MIPDSQEAIELNIVDYVIIAIAGICLILGLYRGFLQSLLNLGGSLLSLILSFALYPKLADALSTNTELVRLISNYTGSSKILGSLDLSKLSVDALSAEQINAIVEKAALPSPLGTILRTNLTQKVFAPLGSMATTVGDYISQTLISTSINVLSFLVCFLGCFLAITVIVNLIRKVFKLPVLRLLDSLAGGVVGLITAALICLALFTVVPLLQSVLPVEGLDVLMEESKLGSLFRNDGLIISIMNRRLF